MATNFPTRAPIGLLLGALLAVGSALGTVVIWRHFQSPLEAFYLRTYVTTGVAGMLQSATHRHTPKQYFVVTVNGLPATPASLPGRIQGVSGRSVFLEPSAFHAWLKITIYGGRSVLDLIKKPLLFAGFMAVFSLIAGLVCDFRRKKLAREGDSLRGPELISARQFNRRQKGDGLAIQIR